MDSTALFILVLVLMLVVGLTIYYLAKSRNEANMKRSRRIKGQQKLAKSRTHSIDTTEAGRIAGKLVPKDSPERRSADGRVNEGSGPVGIVVAGDEDRRRGIDSPEQPDPVANEAASRATLGRADTLGYSPSELKAAMTDQRRLTELAAHLGIAEEAAGVMLITLQQALTPEKWPARLGEMTFHHRQAMEQLSALDLDDPAMLELADQARAAIQLGDNAQAEALVEQMDALRVGEAPAESAVKGQQGASKDAARLAAARLLEVKAELFSSCMRYPQAAETLAAAADLVPDTDLERLVAYQERRARALQRQGEGIKEQSALEEAIAVYRGLIAGRPHEILPFNWQSIQRDLADTLTMLGKRQSDFTRMEEAVEIYRSLLKDCVREQTPVEWAEIQRGLGNTLLSLGQRESGIDRLEEAATAYRAAIEELTHERAPIDWADIERNLGDTLRMIGNRGSSAEGLDDAAAAYRAATREYTRELVPLEWSAIQANLGLTLRLLGQRQANAERLEEAVAVFQSALDEQFRERRPRMWAGAMSELGVTLRLLGQQKRDLGLLEEAATAFLAVQEVHTREHLPVWWATAQIDVGIVHMLSGEQLRDPGLLSQARSELAAAHEIFQEFGNDRQAQYSQNQIARLDAISTAIADAVR